MMHHFGNLFQAKNKINCKHTHGHTDLECFYYNEALIKYQETYVYKVYSEI